MIEKPQPMTPVRTARTMTAAEEWALVLEAEGLAPDIRSLGDEFVILVPSNNAHQAVHALWAYERENPATAPALENHSSGYTSVATGAAFAAALLGFFFLTVLTETTFDWHARGSASAERISQGEFWRTVTALTLHADFAHAAANALAGGFFVAVAGIVLGPGLAVAVILATGAAGNLLNALLHGSAHVSVGASTAIFGAIGLLGGVAFARRRRGDRHPRAWVPLVASVALLAMIGTGGHRVDLWAHLLGLLVGTGAGIYLGMAADIPFSAPLQWKLGIAAGVLVLICWMTALGV